MIYFDKPELFNGSQFIKELKDNGIDIVDDVINERLMSFRLVVNSEGKLGVGVNEDNRTKVQDLLKAHRPVNL